MELAFQPNQEYVITLKEITDLIGVEHNKAMKKVEELALEEGFGTLAKTATVYNSKGQTIQNLLTPNAGKKFIIVYKLKL